MEKITKIDIDNEIALSIIVVVYNTEKFLGKCLESIVKQKLGNIKYEVIIVNDGSTDNSEKICLEYLKKNKKNFKYFLTKNKGCGSARNLGIKMSRGKYIAFIDSDDYIESDMYLEMLNLIREKEADLVVCGIKEIFMNGTIKKNLPGKIENKKKFFKKNSIFNSPTNKLYKLNLIREKRIEFLTNSHMGEDMLFNYIYYQNIKSVFSINKLFYNYIKHEKNATNNLLKRREIFISFKYLKVYLKNKKDIKEFNSLFKTHAISNSYGILEEKKLTQQELKKEKKEIDNQIAEFKRLLNLKSKIHWIYRKIRLKLKKTIQINRF